MNRRGLIHRTALNETPLQLQRISKNMVRSLVVFLLTASAFAPSLAACSCGPGAEAPACSRVGSRSVIFAGRVVFSNDDGSGRFDQGTLIRFTVEEAFQGLPEGTTEVWIDPSSYTSCYHNFPVGGRYLMFASGPLTQRPPSAATKSAWRDSLGRPKPMPPGFDADHPPLIYVTGVAPAPALPTGR